LENVTKQFQEIIPIITSHVNADDFILDSELVGVDSKTDMYLSFQNISQRIKRKHHIEKTAEHIKVEINAFDIIYKDGKVLIDLTQEERRKILEKKGIVPLELLKVLLWAFPELSCFFFFPFNALFFKRNKIHTKYICFILSPSPRRAEIVLILLAL